jgi:hypothetical protein
MSGAEEVAGTMEPMETAGTDPGGSVSGPDPGLAAGRPSGGADRDFLGEREDIVDDPGIFASPPAPEPGSIFTPQDGAEPPLFDDIFEPAPLGADPSIKLGDEAELDRHVSAAVSKELGEGDLAAIDLIENSREMFGGAAARADEGQCEAAGDVREPQAPAPAPAGGKVRNVLRMDDLGPDVVRLNQRNSFL